MKIKLKQMLSEQKSTAAVSYLDIVRTHATDLVIDSMASAGVSNAIKRTRRQLVYKYSKVARAKMLAAKPKNRKHAEKITTQIMGQFAAEQEKIYKAYFKAISSPLKIEVKKQIKEKAHLFQAPKKFSGLRRRTENRLNELDASWTSRYDAGTAKPPAASGASATVGPAVSAKVAMGGALAMGALEANMLGAMGAGATVTEATLAAATFTAAAEFLLVGAAVAGVCWLAYQSYEIVRDLPSTIRLKMRRPYYPRGGWEAPQAGALGGLAAVAAGMATTAAQPRTRTKPDDWVVDAMETGGSGKPPPPPPPEEWIKKFLEALLKRLGYCLSWGAGAGVMAVPIGIIVTGGLIAIAMGKVPGLFIDAKSMLPKLKDLGAGAEALRRLFELPFRIVGGTVETVVKYFKSLGIKGFGVKWLEFKWCAIWLAIGAGTVADYMSGETKKTANEYTKLWSRGGVLDEAGFVQMLFHKYPEQYELIKLHAKKTRGRRPIKDDSYYTESFLEMALKAGTWEDPNLKEFFKGPMHMLAKNTSSEYKEYLRKEKALLDKEVFIMTPYSQTGIYLIEQMLIKASKKGKAEFAKTKEDIKNLLDELSKDAGLNVKAQAALVTMQKLMVAYDYAAAKAEKLSGEAQAKVRQGQAAMAKKTGITTPPANLKVKVPRAPKLPAGYRKPGEPGAGY